MMRASIIQNHVTREWGTAIIQDAGVCTLAAAARPRR